MLWKRLLLVWQRYTHLRPLHQVVLGALCTLVLIALIRILKSLMTRQPPRAPSLGPQGSLGPNQRNERLPAAGQNRTQVQPAPVTPAASSSGSTIRTSSSSVLPPIGPGSTPAEQYLIHKSTAKVALAGHGVLYNVSKGPEASDGVVVSLIPSSIPIFKRLLASCDVYVVNMCSSREEEDAILRAMLEAGLVSPVVSKPLTPLARLQTGSPRAGTVDDTKLLLPLQRLLFCSSAFGKQSIFRHIEPWLLVDVDVPVIKALKPYVHQVVQVLSPSALQRLPSSAPALLASPSLQPLASATGTSSPNASIPVCGSLAAFFYPELDQELREAPVKSGIAESGEYKEFPQFSLDLQQQSSRDAIPFSLNSSDESSQNETEGKSVAVGTEESTLRSRINSNPSMRT